MKYRLMASWDREAQADMEETGGSQQLTLKKEAPGDQV